MFTTLEFDDGLAEGKLLMATALLQKLEQQSLLRDNSITKPTHNLERLQSVKNPESSSHPLLSKQTSMMMTSPHQKKMDEAISLIHKARIIFDKMDNLYGKAKACYMLADLYLEKQFGFEVDVKLDYTNGYLEDILEVCNNSYEKLGNRLMEAMSLYLKAKHWANC